MPGPRCALQELADKYEYDALTQLLEEACQPIRTADRLSRQHHDRG